MNNIVTFFKELWMTVMNDIMNNSVNDKKGHNIVEDKTVFTQKVFLLLLAVVIYPSLIQMCLNTHDQ